jgi:hypothetical protein
MKNCYKFPGFPVDNAVKNCYKFPGFPVDNAGYNVVFSEMSKLIDDLNNIFM